MVFSLFLMRFLRSQSAKAQPNVEFLNKTPYREQIARIKWLGLHLRVAGRVEPFFARAIVVQLDPVAIQVAQVDRNGAAVIFGAIDAVFVIEDALNRASEILLVRVDDREVV